MRKNKCAICKIENVGRNKFTCDGICKDFRDRGYFSNGNFYLSEKAKIKYEQKRNKKN